MPCNACRETPGFVEVKRGTVKPCDCRQRQIALRMARFADAGDGPSEADVRTLAEVMARQFRGRAKAAKWREVAQLVFGREGMKDAARKMRAVTNAAVEAGHPIASGNFGYFYATTPEELDDTIARLDSQAFKQLERARRLRVLQGQLRRERDGAVWETQE